MPEVADSDNLAVEVHQGSAAVARIHEGVGLDEILIHGRGAVALQDIGTPLGAYMAKRDAVVEIERGADGDGKFAHARPGRVRQHGDGQSGCLNFDHRQIGLRVHAADFGREAAAVLELDLNFLGVLDDVAIGENVAVLADDHAGAFAAHVFGCLLLELLVEVTPELARQRVKRAV